MSVTGKGQVSQRTSFVVLISIVAILLSAMALYPARDGPRLHRRRQRPSDERALLGSERRLRHLHVPAQRKLFCDANDGATRSPSSSTTASAARCRPAARVVVYLSPNKGAINGNAGGDPAGYIADVESNFVVLDVGGLSGSGTLTFDVPVTTGFTVSTGGILGVFATEAPLEPATTGAVVSNSKTNSLNCTEAESTPTPSPTPARRLRRPRARRLRRRASPTASPTPSPTASPTASPTPRRPPTPTPSPTASPTRFADREPNGFADAEPDARPRASSVGRQPRRRPRRRPPVASRERARWQPDADAGRAEHGGRSGRSGIEHSRRSSPSSRSSRWR